MRAMPRLLVSALVLAGAGTIYAWFQGPAWALARAGYREDRAGAPQAYFAARARPGSVPAAVAAAMPRPAAIERYITPVTGGSDSMLVERYVYRAGLGTWPVDVYYVRGGGVVGLYAQDQRPSLRGARPVTAADAERWRVGPGAPDPR